MSSKLWRMVAVTEKCTFADICTKKGLPYTHGCGFYQLASSENVNPNKLLVATNEDNGEIIAGTADVRKRLNIGVNETSLKPKDVPSPWTLYINSTSGNRGLKPKTTVMIRVGQASTEHVVQKGDQTEEKDEQQKKKEEDAASPAAKPKPKAVRKTETTHVSKSKKRVRGATPSDEDDDKEAEAPPMKKQETDASASKKKAATGGGGDEDKAPSTSGGGNGDLKPLVNLVAWTKKDADGWLWYNTLMATETTSSSGCKKAPSASAKIAAFDYDGCLANTSLFKKGPDAWSLLMPSVPDVLSELHGKGYRLVIMSNQAAIGKATASKEKTIEEKKKRFEGLVEKVGLPFTTMAATAKTDQPDPYRKPACGMWDFLEKHLNNGVKIDRAKSFYVGDAAGRKKDHSDSDMKCAQNFGVPFFTETECFKDRKYRSLF